MDWPLIIARIVHIGSGMIWFGGAVIGSFFLQRTARDLGDAGRPFMEHLLRRRRLGVLFPVVATLTIVAGAALYWRDSGGLQTAWITSPIGIAYTIGGLAALAAYVGGMVLIGPSVAAQAAVARELATGDGTPSEEQRRRLAKAERGLRLADRIDMPLLTLAVLTMAVGRYL